MTHWYVLKDRLHHGPFTKQELESQVLSREFKKTDFICEAKSFESHQIKYITISDILGDEIQPLSSSDKDLRASSNIKPSLTDNDSKPQKTEQDPSNDVNTSGKTSQFFQKIEAVELIDASPNPKEVGVSSKSVELDREDQFKNFIDSIFKIGAPVLGVVAVLALAGWGLMNVGFDSESQPPLSQNAAPRSKPKLRLPAAKELKVEESNISVPKISERAKQGYEKVVVQELTPPAQQSTEIAIERDEEEPKERLKRARKERRTRLEKLRNELEPMDDSLDGAPLPGVAAEEDGYAQEDYDMRRESASESEGWQQERDKDGYYEDDYDEDLIYGDEPVLDREEDLRY